MMSTSSASGAQKTASDGSGAVFTGFGSGGSSGSATTGSSQAQQTGAKSAADSIRQLGASYGLIAGGSAFLAGFAFML